MHNGITYSMKTAISVDDQLMEEADSVARQMGLSRSGLVSRALQDFLRLRRGEALTAKLNEVYSAGERNADADRDLALTRKFKRKLTLRDSW